MISVSGWGGGGGIRDRWKGVTREAEKAEVKVFLNYGYLTIRYKS